MRPFPLLELAPLRMRFEKKSPADALGRLGRREGLDVVTVAAGDPHGEVVSAAERARARLARQ